MKIGFYNPYLDSLGGGERFVLTIADHWSKTHEVSIFWDDPAIIKRAQDRFFLSLKHVSVEENIFSRKNIVGKLWDTLAYDLIVTVSDGSVPVTFARHNVVIFQAPMSRIRFPWWKQTGYDAAVCYSDFVKTHIDPGVRRKLVVIAPPVDTKRFVPMKKESMILSVGRFSAYGHSKKQEILIESFKLLVKHKMVKNVRLVLAGGLMDSDKEYFDKLVDLSKGHPIQFAPNIPMEKLAMLYGSARVYWHAAGFGQTQPERMEHFGISTIEAMAAGAVPIVFAGGGQTEIVDNGKDGYLWQTKEELIQRTREVFANQTKQKELQTQGFAKAKLFDEHHFCSVFDRLLESFS